MVSTVVVLPECLLPTTAIIGIGRSGVMVFHVSFALSYECLWSGISVFSVVRV